MEGDSRLGFAFCRSTELRDGKETGIAPWADCGDEDCRWNHPDLFIRLIESNCIVMSSVMMRRESFERVGPFQLDLPFALDWYMWCMLALHYDAAYFSEPMVCCRFHEKSLTSQYSKEHTRICIADELAVLWRIGQQAGYAGNPVLGGVCKSTFFLRAHNLLMWGLQGLSPSLTTLEFDEILRNRIPDFKSDVSKSNQIRASVYTTLADQLYFRGEYSHARQAYLHALEARPWRPRTWIKLLLLRTGGIGIRIRNMAN
jgi:hypothetical protein